MKKVLLSSILICILTSGCYEYLDSFEPNETKAFIGRFKLEDGFLTQERAGLFSLNTDGVQDSIPFYIQTSQQGDSLIQTLTHNIDGKEIVSAYSLPQQIGPGEIINVDDFRHNDEPGWFTGYRSPLRPDLENVQLIGAPLGDFTFNFIWKGMTGLQEFRRLMSSENAKVGITQFRPFSDSEEENGSTILLIVYTHN